MNQIKILVCLGMTLLIAACSPNKSKSHERHDDQGVQTQTLNTSKTWQAMSRTATSITGDITVTANQITFQNGASLSIRAVDEDSEQGITLYKVVSSNNPKLLNDNYICGNSPVNYLSFKKVGASLKPDLSMTVYYAKSLQLQNLVLPDQTTNTANICAIYNYVH
jgi:hypothetical protein